MIAIWNSLLVINVTIGKWIIQEYGIGTKCSSTCKRNLAEILIFSCVFYNEIFLLGTFFYSRTLIVKPLWDELMNYGIYHKLCHGSYSWSQVYSCFVVTVLLTLFVMISGQISICTSSLVNVFTAGFAAYFISNSSLLLSHISICNHTTTVMSWSSKIRVCFPPTI